MNAALHHSLGSLDERLVALGRHLAAVEGSVRETADLADELAGQANSALEESARGLGERLDVLGRRLNTLQESARLEPDLAQPLLASKPWRLYLWLGRAKRALTRKLARLTGPLRSTGSARRLADLEAQRRHNRPRRSLRASRHRALLIDHRLPRPDRDAGSLRVSHLTSVLQEAGFEVSFLPHDLQAAEPYATDLREHKVEVLAAPAISSVAAHLEDRGADYDLVIVSRAHVATDCIGDVRALCPRAKVIFDTVDLNYLRESRRAELEESDSLREAATQRREQELGTARQADLTLVVSQAEKNLLGHDAPEVAVHVLATIHHRRRAPAGFAERRDLLFLADFEQPHNVDAAVWLVGEILPAIRSRLPEARLHLVGNEPPEPVRKLASESVVVAGFVPDVESYLSGCRLSLAPLRYGAGIMAKTTQAMAHGLPSVTTTIGAEGIGLVHGADAMIADANQEFADCVARVYEDEALWLKLSQGGLDRVRDEYSFAAARRSVAAMLEAVGHPRALERKLHTAEFGTPD
jgi:glycosyltransferase involved in cell wall biosynthesis